MPSTLATRTLVALALPVFALTAAARAQQQPVSVDAQDNLTEVLRQSEAPMVPGELIVGLRPGKAAVQGRNRVAARVSGRVTGYDPKTGTYRVKVGSRVGLAEAIKDLRSMGEVAYAEPNYIYSATATPNDPQYAAQWALPKTAANVAWDYFVPKAAVTVAVIDTGVKLDHQDLSGKILRSSTGAVVGYDYVNNDADPSDDQGHGTHCAGIVAAQANNGVGVAGVAGVGTFAKIMPVKVLGADGNGYLSAVASGITYAADNGAKVISLSLGGPASSYTLQNAIAYAWNKGCVVVAAAGNESTSNKSYPAAYPNVIAVASTNGTDTLSSFSNFGAWVTVAAPGESIVATYHNGGYGYMSGTSMATPFVAGEVAMLAAHNPALTNVQLRAAVVNNTDSFTPFSGRTIAGGRVNVLRALQSATAAPAPAPVIQPTPPPAPTVTVPTAPTTLTAAATSRSTVNLAWQNTATNATAVRVQVSLDGVSFKDQQTAAATATSLSVAGLYPNMTYFFRVRAENSAGTSSWSAAARTTTPRR